MIDQDGTLLVLKHEGSPLGNPSEFGATLNDSVVLNCCMNLCKIWEALLPWDLDLGRVRIKPVDFLHRRQKSRRVSRRVFLVRSLPPKLNSASKRRLLFHDSNDDPTRLQSR